MKRGVFVGVVLAHVAVVAGILLFQGCGKTVQPASPPPKPALSEPVLPPGEPKPVSVIPATPLPKPPSKAEIKPAQLPPPSAIHVVAKGENLTTIAKRYGVKAADLVALNRLGNANRLREGQELVVPGPAATAQVPAAAPVTATAGQPEAEIVYTVAQGDYLGRIASRHGTTVAVIKQRNGLKSDTVRIGQKLKIPSKGPVASAVKAEGSASVAAPAPAPKAVKEPTSSEKPVTVVKSPAPVSKQPSIDLDAKPVTSPAVDAPKSGGAEAIPLLVHEVQPNEDLVKIAMMYGVSVEAVKKANGMTGESVRPGQRLKIP